MLSSRISIHYHFTHLVQWRLICSWASRSSTPTTLIYHNSPFPLPHPGTLKHMYTHTHTHTHSGVWITLTFSGSALFWVSPRASNAITAMTQEKPRMLSMFLEQNTFSSDSKIKRRENNKKWTDIDFPIISVWPMLAFWRQQRQIKADLYPWGTCKLSKS